MAEKKNGNLLKLKKQLKEGILAPLYVFYGEEDYLREMYVNRGKRLCSGRRFSGL